MEVEDGKFVGTSYQQPDGYSFRSILDADSLSFVLRFDLVPPEEGETVLLSTVVVMGLRR